MNDQTLTMTKLSAGRYVGAADGVRVIAYRSGSRWLAYVGTDADGYAMVAAARTLTDATAAAGAVVAAMTADADADAQQQQQQQTDAATDHATDASGRKRPGAAGSYKCKPCKDESGRRVPATGRYRVDGKRVALCAAHAETLGVVRAAQQARQTDAAAADGADAYAAASRSARTAWDTAARVAALNALPADAIAVWRRAAGAACGTDTALADDMADRMMDAYVDGMVRACVHAYPRAAASTIDRGQARDRNGRTLTARGAARAVVRMVRPNRTMMDSYGLLADADAADRLTADAGARALRALSADDVAQLAAGFRVDVLRAMAQDGHRSAVRALVTYDRDATGYQRPAPGRSVDLRAAASTYARYADAIG